MACCAQCRGIEKQFNDKVARRELRRYRRRGPTRPTKKLLEFLASANVSRASLLDIGGGVGSIQHEMADSGTVRITSVDASPAYIEAARAEAERRGYAERATYVEGDFVDATVHLDRADVVTLDRVICCYHDVDSLLGGAAARADQAVGLVYPREDAHIRIGMRMANFALKLFRSDFRAFLHPHAKVRAILDRQGFTESAVSDGLVWRVSLFVKSN